MTEVFPVTRSKVGRGDHALGDEQPGHGARVLVTFVDLGAHALVLRPERDVIAVRPEEMGERGAPVPRAEHADVHAAPVGTSGGAFARP